MISVGRRVWVAAAWDLLLVLLVHGLVCDDRGACCCVCVASAVGCVQNKGGMTAAMGAARYGHTDCLTALIDHKADLDIQVRGW